jgi:hypothetical protein
MKRFTKALVLGIAAGIVDVLPMVVMKSNFWAMASAFTHWVIIGVLVVYLQVKLRPWQKGLLVGSVSAIPVLFMVYPVEPTALAPITMMSVILGTAVGYVSGKLG